MPYARRLCLRLRAGQDGFGILEVVIAMVVIVSTSLLAITSLTIAFRDGDVGSQRLQASQLLATVLRTGGCGSSVNEAQLGTTYHITVTPSSCSGGASETASATWTSSGKTNEISMTGVSPPSSGTASAYAVTT